MHDKASSSWKSGLGRDTWMRRIAQIGAEHGLYDRIGKRHLGLYVEEGETLLVAFDRADRVWSEAPDGLPAGFEMVRRRSWSLLSIMAVGETWFRDPALERFFSVLTAGGILRRYSSVVFYGVGPECGFAACVHSATMPGARVLAASPVATLNHADVPFERRFRAARRLDFTGPSGNAPLALRSASDALVLYDPAETADAAQAALFNGANTTRVGLPHAGRDFEAILHGEEAAVPLLRMLSRGRCDPARVRAALKGPCREAPGTMIRRARAAMVQGHSGRAALIARHGYAASGDRRLGALLTEIEARRKEDLSETETA
ncbi:phosphoadenosine phosphosulfate reductase [Roseibacterium sp. SDUM158017]|uniref:phosphoadenosine phosphosulfate reductase n=1 Tax=Roseicyclus salinarum TaxID=3036773 RepID=UPI0024159305|nr:phosphoadenosine phosphosulfate reductase [Roseibacterium sp. SDUM158017]MDG4650038.1 phosphoadenosine phosphosulfate reductase [Roseibacterium sp. SDUM158017]